MDNTVLMQHTLDYHEFLFLEKLPVYVTKSTPILILSLKLDPNVLLLGAQLLMATGELHLVYPMLFAMGLGVLGIIIFEL